MMTTKIMANKNGALLLHLLLLLLESSQFHCRSMPGDYDTEPHATISSHTEFQINRQFQQSNADAETFAAEWDSQATIDTPSFAIQTDEPSYDYTSTAEDDTPAAASWDPVTVLDSTPTGQQQTSSPPASPGSETEFTELADDESVTFIDSPEIIEDADAGGVDDEATPYSHPSGTPTAEAYANDEVYFNTSEADTIYKSSDEGLSLVVANMNENSTDEMLTSLAKAMGGCGTGNPIDDCWRCDKNWRNHRQSLASCATGFGRNAIGGKNGPIYTVTSNGDDTVNPQRGTLRYGVTREGPLWIVFAESMTIKLKGELWISAYKTVDGRGAEVHIVGGAQVSIQKTNNVILHGLHIHDIKPSGPSTIRVSPSKVVKRGKSEGDGIHVWESHDVWIDHCYLARATDGLLDVTRGSTMITVSNCFFEKHDKTLLFGASPQHTEDRNMRVTVAFNKFGPGLIQRLPRCRFGVFHVLNNDYTSGWDKYAIGGSEDPTILSQGNLFKPTRTKEVTQRIDDGGSTYGGWKTWDWASSGDVFLNGAYFTGSGASASSASAYAKAYSSSSRPASLVPALTKAAGPLKLQSPN